MKAKYIGKSESYALDNGKIYKILSVEQGWYRVLDKSGEDCLYQLKNLKL